MIERLFVHPLTHLRAGEVADRRGNLVKSWDAAVPRSVLGWLAQVNSFELTEDGREAQVSGWLLSLPAGFDVLGGDRFQRPVDGALFEVDGPPNHAGTPRGPHHVECRLKAVVG